MPSSHSLAVQGESVPDGEAATPLFPRTSAVWDPAHLGDLSGQLPTELVGAALTVTLSRERRIRALPSRVIVYFVLALALFPERGYRSVLGKLRMGTGMLASVSASALAQARRRIGVAPLRWIFERLRGPAPTITGEGAWFGAMRICALDGTILTLPDTPTSFPSTANRPATTVAPGTRRRGSWR
ncbi:transposase domain-containing protein [Arthrobacter sp. Sr24]